MEWIPFKSSLLGLEENSVATFSFRGRELSNAPSGGLATVLLNIPAASGISPESHEAIVLCLLSFPAMAFEIETGNDRRSGDSQA